MPRKWLFEVHSEGETKDGYVIHLALTGAEPGASVDIVPLCRSLDQFRAELALLGNELDQMAVAAEARIRELATGSDSAMVLDPAAVWGKMQACTSREDMFDHFNSFEASARQQIADYILAHASMFKGWGPVFAEYYDLTSFRLEP